MDTVWDRSTDELRDLLASELGDDVSIDVVEDRDRVDIRISQYGGASRPGTDNPTLTTVSGNDTNMNQYVVGLKDDIRDVLTTKIDDDVRVEFVEDGNRIDVRVSNLGVVDEIEEQHDVSVTSYSEFRFTVMLD